MDMITHILVVLGVSSAIVFSAKLSAHYFYLTHFRRVISAQLLDVRLVLTAAGESNSIDAKVKIAYAIDRLKDIA